MSVVHYVLAMNYHRSSRSLYQVTENLDRTAIIQMLNRGADPSLSDSDGESVLHLVFKRCLTDSEGLQWRVNKILEIYLNMGIGVNRKNSSGKTALYLAIRKGLKDVAKFLIERGARFDVPDKRGNTTLHFMVEDEFDKFCRRCLPNGSFSEKRVIKPEGVDFIEWLMSKATNVDCKNNDGNTPLLLAARRNLLHVVLILLKYTKDVTLVDNKHQTVFHIFLESIARFDSCDRSRQGIPTFCYKQTYVSEIAKTMLEKGFSIDVIDKNGNSPIVIAMKQKQTEIVRMMLEYPILSSKEENAKVTTVNDFSLVQLAVVTKNMTVLQDLKENGVDFGVLHNGSNLLHLLSTSTGRSANNSTYETIVDLLVNQGCDVNARNDQSMTPLHLASQSAILPIVKRLIEHGANVHSRQLGHRRLTALHESVDNNCDEVIELLVNAGADVNARTSNGQTPLHLAMLYNNGNMVRTLLRLGAHVDVQDDEGRVPLYDAICYHNISALKELLKFGVDINDRGAYREIMNLSEIGSVMSTMLEHWIKIQVIGLPAANYYRYQVVDRSMQQFYNECLNEAEALENCLLKDGTSMYDLLRMNPNRRCNYLTNEGMKDLLLSPKLENLFPKYHTLIQACYHQAAARKPLLEPAKCAWYELTKIRLPDTCVDRILFYVNNMTLRIMVGSLKDRSLREGAYDSR